MNNLFSKSANRLLEKSSNTPEMLLMNQLKVVQTQNRLLRQDMVDIKLMINKLLVDKHLQMQVDNYFDKDEEHLPIEDLA